MRLRLVFLLLACALSAGCAAVNLTRPLPPIRDLNAWHVEQMPGGHVRLDGDTLDIQDANGCTVWFREQLVAPVEIEFSVTVVDRGGPFDRVSDLNCFWMASDPRSPDQMPRGRSGRFSDYDSLQTYYVGYGGNQNSTTRFRRYTGTGERPLEPGNDLRAPEFLLRGNHTYRIRVVARDGVAEYWRDGERIFAFRDPAPLTHGWFGFRTIKSHLRVHGFAVKRLAP